jgi:thiamine-phosphate pyrophosphorylase
MPPNLKKPIIYLITSGKTTLKTTSATDEYREVLDLVQAAISAAVPLLQIREKQLTDRTLYQLSVDAAKLAEGTPTRVLINDRADIARAAGAHGVHLTSRSIKAEIVRRTFRTNFLIGVSTHSAEEIAAAQAGGADFSVFGPVFKTESKLQYGDPVGLAKLREVVAGFGGFPILALGGVTVENARNCLSAGVAGVAAIRMLNDPDKLASVIELLRSQAEEGGE